MSTTTTNNMTVFLDTIGRTIIGKISKEDKDTLSVQNPALVHIQPNPQSGQLQLQILPLFFKEFQLNREQPTIWTYKKQSITLSETIDLAPQFIAQYEQMFQTSPPAQPQGEPKVVKLFDE